VTDPPRLLGPRRIQDLLARHGVRPRKRLGQNFVVDPNTIRKVVALAEVAPTETVVEVGAGAGSLTLGLAAVAKRVIALEVDPALVPVLEEVVEAAPNVAVRHADALETDLASLGGDALVGNLPYNVASRLVLDALERAPGIGQFTVMTQREVGERLAAAPGTKAYGGISVMVACFAEARVVAKVSRNAFYPVPRVDSVVVSLRRRERPGDARMLAPVVRAAFSQRRKSLRNSLGTLADVRRAEIALAAAGVAPLTRAEELGVDDFFALARALAAAPVDGAAER
jgi:16S rRNA (adenine1518-N6/adenine1519-N6)-dimethyltransferase